MGTPRPYNRGGVQLSRDGLLGWRLRPVDPKSGRQLDQVFWGSEQQAMSALSDLERVLSGKVGPSLANSRTVTVSQWAPLFLAAYAWKVPAVNGKGGMKRPYSTWANMRDVLSAYVVPALGPNTRLVTISYDDCVRAVSQLTRKDGADVSAATRRTVAEKLSGLLAGAVSAGILTSNPAAGLPSTWGEARERVVVPSLVQVRLLAQALETAGQLVMADMVTVLAYTGLRFEELAALTPADVDLDRSVITVNKVLTESGGRRQARDVTKTAAGVRELLVLEQVKPALARLLVTSAARDSKFLVSGKRGGPISYGLWRRHLKLAQATSGVPYTAHELRHVCASLLIAAGASIETVRQQMGHSTTEVTQVVYRHLWKRDRTADAAALSALVAAL